MICLRPVEKVWRKLLPGLMISPETCGTPESVCPWIRETDSGVLSIIVAPGFGPGSVRAKSVWPGGL